ncbi:peroxisomal membrane protein [Emericellopsis atlantica]|uniref:Peroxisomal membrane protein PEX14 n=1 Tax=Emericellopsis atlantica TaxID=2614577 RepID=A0A9P7ZS42_9HYPO|nr:peroxisomal membrane protein [Emericellopsis atlantica]KAG9256837.1 peroxisomal membrane protein [Emericellopsis atlantica]
MSIREDLVASAVQFLQDPSVASSSVENRISFLRSKNLTQQEIDNALARTGAPPAPAQQTPYPQSGPPAPYYPPYAQQAWQPPPPPPRRDWRDWFIAATVAGGVGYGLYALGKRYVMPLVAPPTPEKLEQDKKSIEEQFDRAFSLVEQLAKDTEELKKAEQARSDRLDNALSDLEAVMSDLKAANRRREDDAQRVREEVQGLKDSIPKALNNQKELADTRLREINGELGSLKTLVTQRMSAPAASSPTAPLRNGTPASTNAPSGTAVETAPEPSAAASSPSTESPKKPWAPTTRAKPSIGGKAAIPAWQMAAAKKEQEEGGSSATTPAPAKVEDEPNASASS